MQPKIMLISKGEEKMKKYTSPELEITIVDCDDVVTSSGVVYPGIELPDDDLTDDDPVQ